MAPSEEWKAHQREACPGPVVLLSENLHVCPSKFLSNIRDG